MAQEEGCMLHFALVTFMISAMAVCALHSDQASVKYLEEAICQLTSLHEDDKKSRVELVRKCCEENGMSEIISELMAVSITEFPPQKDCSEFRLDKSLSNGATGEREKS